MDATGYLAMIQNATGCTPQQAAKVEEIMRVERKTLDGLTRSAFNQLARKAYQAYQEVGDLGLDDFPT